MSTRPTGAWVGKWVSVTGLVEPPYAGKHYGRPYRNVGVTVTSDNQIIHILEQDAKFRLGRGRVQRSPGITVDLNTHKPKNTDILEGIRGDGQRPSNGRPTTGVPTPQTASTQITATQTTAAQTTTTQTRNEQILRGLQTAAPQTQPNPQTHSPSASSPGLLSRIPIWLWIGAIILLLIIVSHIK
jgi:hypothetical protein